MSHRHQHHNGRHERRPWKTRAQLERENQEESDRHEAEVNAHFRQLADTSRAAFDALPDEERARIEAHDARIRAESWAEHERQTAWREQRDREKRESITLGT